MKKRGKSCASGCAPGFESKDGMAANPFGWTILGVSRVISYSWRIRWPLNNRNHTTSLQYLTWGAVGCYGWDSDGSCLERSEFSHTTKGNPRRILVRI